MGAIYYYRANKCRLSVKYVCEQLLSRLTSHVVVAVSGVPGEMPVAYAVLLEGVQHFVLVVCHDIVKFIEKRLYFLFAGIDQIENLFRYSKFVNEYIF